MRRGVINPPDQLGFSFVRGKEKREITRTNYSFMLSGFLPRSPKVLRNFLVWITNQEPYKFKNKQCLKNPKADSREHLKTA